MYVPKPGDLFSFVHTERASKSAVDSVEKFSLYLSNIKPKLVLHEELTLFNTRG